MAYRTGDIDVSIENVLAWWNDDDSTPCVGRGIHRIEERLGIVCDSISCGPEVFDVKVVIGLYGRLRLFDAFRVEIVRWRMKQAASGFV